MLQAIGKNIFCKPVFEETKLQILTLENKKPKHYLVVSVGQDVSNIQEGDQILARDRYNEMVVHKSEEFVVFTMDDVLAKAL